MSSTSQSKSGPAIYRCKQSIPFAIIGCGLLLLAAGRCALPDMASRAHAVQAQTEKSSAETQPKEKQAESPARPETTQNKSADSIPFLDLDEALDRSHLHGRPVILVFTATWFADRDELVKVLSSAEIQARAADWIWAQVDFDKQRETALRYRVLDLPEFHILDPSGNSVAKNSGLLDARQLAQWMDSNRKRALPKSPVVLIANEAPTRTEIKELIELLSDPNPEIREVAIDRLVSFPEKTREPLVELLIPDTANADSSPENSPASKTNPIGLAARIGIVTVLKRWDAPVADIDPWSRDSLTPERIDRLVEWKNTPIENLPAAQGEFTQEELQQAAIEIDRYVADATEPTRLLPRFSRFGKQLLPEVNRRLAIAESDESRQKLLALRYWLVASNRLRLAWSHGFWQLANLQLDYRREAVKQLLGRITSEDADLLLELFADSDPLIRELCLKGLESVGAKQTDLALVRLLQDPDLNVRAAVLKQLAEEKSDRMMIEVAKYLDTEQDQDLIVHALRYFKETPKAELQLPVLSKLFDHSSWQVRAMVAEVLGKLAKSYDTPSPLKSKIAEVLAQLGNDTDGFVSSRAIEGMQAPTTKAAMERLAKLAEQRPEAANVIATLMSANDKDDGYDPSDSRAKKISPVPHFERFLESENAKLRRAGVIGMAESEIAKLDFEKLFADPDLEIRIAGIQAFVKRVHSLRDFQENVAQSDTRRGTASSPVVPSFLQRVLGKSSSKSAKTDSKKEVTEEASTDEDDDAATKEIRLPPLAEEQWIDDWIRNAETRPEWINRVEPMLKKMAESKDRPEQIKALIALGVLQPKESYLDQLLEFAASDAKVFQEITSLMMWMPFDQRVEFLDRQLALRQHVTEFESVIIRFAFIRNPRAADVLWSKIGNLPIDSQRWQRSLIAAYLGGNMSYYRLIDAEELDKDLRADTVRRIQQQVAPDENPSALKQQIALAMLQALDVSAAGSLADRMLADSIDESAKIVALRVKLLLQSEAELSSYAADLLQEPENWKRRWALRALTLGPDAVERTESADAVTLSRSINRMFSHYSSDDVKLRVPKAPEGLELSTVLACIENVNQQAPLTAQSEETLALATYLAILLKDDVTIDPLLDYWAKNKDDAEISMLVVDTIVMRKDNSLMPLLTEIYETHGGKNGEYFSRNFYWTVRTMTGPAALRLRQRIRDEVGMDQLGR